MKGRVFIWTIVGIIVVAGVVFILSKPRVPGAEKMTTDDLRRGISQSEVQLNRLSAKLVAARGAVPPPANAAKVEETDKLLSEARSKLTQLKQVADLKQGGTQLREIKQTIRQARRALELALGAAGRPHGL